MNTIRVFVGRKKTGPGETLALCTRENKRKINGFTNIATGEIDTERFDAINQCRNQNIGEYKEAIIGLLACRGVQYNSGSFASNDTKPLQLPSFVKGMIQSMQ